MQNRALQIGYYALLAVLGVIALFLVISALPITGNYKFYVVRSGSMEPAIRTGSVVMVRPQSAYRIGDVITFSGVDRNRIPVTHRIHEIAVEKGDPVYITKGDANNAPDTREIHTRDIYGGVAYALPYIGYAVEAARKPYGFLALIIIPALLIVSDEVRKIWKEVKRMRASQVSEPTAHDATL